MAKVNVNTEENIVTVLADGTTKTVRVNDSTQNRIIKVQAPGPKGDPGKDGAAFTGTLTGSLNVSGSINLVGTMSSSGGITAPSFTGSLSGSVANINGTQYYVPRFTQANGLTNSRIYQSGSYTAIGENAPEDPLNPDILYLSGYGIPTYNLLSAHSDYDNYVQLNVQNTYNGSNASADIVASNNFGNETGYYIDMGINSQAYSAQANVGGSNDAYLYSTGADLLIGNASVGQRVIIFNGGFDHEANAKVYIHDTGVVGINTNTYNAQYPPSLFVKSIDTSTVNVISAIGEPDNYLQVTNTNRAAGSFSSADFVAYNNIDPDNQLFGYIDMGINSSVYVGDGTYPGTAGDAYLFTDSHHLLLGTLSGSGAAKVTIFAGGISEAQNAKLILYGNNRHEMTGSLTATEGFSGSLFGTASWAVSASNALTASYALNAGISDPFPYTGSAIITGSLKITGSLSVRDSITAVAFTGSVLGTSSFATSAETASYAPLYLPLTGGTINGNVTVNGTASIAFLNVTYESSSIIISTGSNVFGDAANDSQTLYGTVSIPTGSFSVSGSTRITGSLNVTAGITGSLFGTSSWANSSSVAISSSYSLSSSYSVTASYASTATVFPFTGSAIISGSLSVSGSTSINSAAGTTLLSTNADTLIITGSLIVTGSTIITGSLKVSGSITGSLFGTASNAVSASYSVSSSYSLSSSFATTSSYALTASYVLNAVSSSFSSTASFVTTAQTASYITGSVFNQLNPALSASYSLSSSYASNGGVTQIIAGTNISISPTSGVGAITINAAGAASPFPYTGSAQITGSLGITGSIFVTQSHISTVDWIDFNIDPGTLTHLEGRVHWNVDRKTLQLDTDVNNFMIPVGHASVLRGRNNNSYTLTKGTVVYINGNSGQFATFGTASWEDDPRSAYTIGIIAQDINSNNYGYAVTNGEITGINTNGYGPATLLYLSSSGRYTDEKPIAPFHTVRLGQVVVASTNGILQVKVDNGYETDELHDVLLANTASGDLMVKSGSLWINSKQLVGVYSITGSLTATSFTGSLFGTSSFAITASYIDAGFY